MTQQNARCPECGHKEIAHSPDGCAVGIRTATGITPCPCSRKAR